MSLVELSFGLGSNSSPRPIRLKCFPQAVHTTGYSPSSVLDTDQHKIPTGAYLRAAQKHRHPPKVLPKSSEGKELPNSSFAPGSAKQGAADTLRGGTHGCGFRGAHPSSYLHLPSAACCSSPWRAHWLWGWHWALPPSLPWGAACPVPSPLFSADRFPSHERSACSPTAERQRGSGPALPWRAVPSSPLVHGLKAKPGSIHPPGNWLTRGWPASGLAVPGTYHVLASLALR